MTNPNPAIVDLLRSSDSITTIEGITVGKFHPFTGELSYSLAQQRALNIIKLLRSPDPLTFYVNDNWQSFAIVVAVSGYFDVKPRVIVITDLGEMIDLVDYFGGTLFDSLKGGGELGKVSVYDGGIAVITNSQKNNK